MRLLSYIASLLLVAGLLAVAPSASAAFPFQEVHIDIVGGDSLASDPGEVVTIVYRITPTADTPESLHPTFTLPEGWSIVFGTDPVHFQKGGSTTRFVTYKIPESALSAPYEIVFSLTDESETMWANATSSVFVQRIAGLEFTSNPVAPYVSAGKQIKATFTLLNSGNADSEVSLKSTDRSFTRTSFPFEKLKLAPGEFKSFDVTIDTDANLDHSQRASLRFEASIDGSEQQTRFATIAFDIVPVYARVRPKAANTPLSIAFETVGDESGAVPQATINAKGKMLGGTVSVSATLAEMPRQKFYGQDAHFQATFVSDDVFVQLGDHSQTISPLTLTGEKGMGASADVSLGDWNVKATAQRARFIFPVQERLAFSVGYATSSTSMASVNFLHRNGFYEGSIVSLRTLTRPFGQTSKLDLECGMDNAEAFRDPSCSMQLTNSSRRLSYRFGAQRGSSAFPGSMSGTTQLSEYLSYRLSSSIRIDNNLNLTKRSLGDGFERSNMFAKLGMTWSQRVLGGSLYISAHGIVAKNTYSNITSASDRTENTFRSTLGYHMRRMGLTVSVEQGSSRSSSDDISGGLSRFKSNYRYSLTRNWTVNGSWEMSSGNLSALALKQTQRQLGLGSTVTIANGWTASATAFQSTVETTIRQQYASLRGSLMRRFRSGRTLSARIQMNHSAGRQDIRTADYRLSFTTPLASPFGRSRSDNEILRGRIVDQDTGAPASGVLMFFGNELAITDDKGRFVFARDPENTAFLRVDQQTLGYDRIPEMTMPIQVGPSDWLEGELVIPVSKASRVFGILESFRASASKDFMVGVDSDSLIVVQGMSGAVVQIENDQIRLRTRTSESGRFEFTQLPPGTYEVSIIKANTNEYQRLERSSVKVILEQGASKELQFRVVPARKKIRMINSSSLSIQGASGVANSISSTRAPAPPNTYKLIEEDESAESQETSAPIVPVSGSADGSKNPTPDGSRSHKAPATGGSSVSKNTNRGSNGSPSMNLGSPAADQWFELLKESAKEGSEQIISTEPLSKATIATPFIPYYVERPHSAESSRQAKMHGLLFVLCMLFLLVDIDLLVRYAVTRRMNGIHSMKDPAWFAIGRQLVIYLFAITVATVSWGLLAGISVSLALSGISVAVETRNTYRSLWNIAWLMIQGIKVNSWVVWRKNAICIQGIGIETIWAMTLDGQDVDIPTYRAHVLLDELLSERDARQSQFSIDISRMANLRHVRSLLEETLRPLSPSGVRSNVGIEFIDLDEHRTQIRVSMLASASYPDMMKARVLCEDSLATAGIPRVQGLKSASEIEPISRGGKTYGPLKLVQPKRAA